MDRFLIAVIAVVALALPIVNAEGDKCGTDRFRCKYRASCSEITNKCECKDELHGIPQLFCSAQAFSSCQMVSDPQGQTFVTEPEHPVKYSLPCRYLLTDHSITREQFTEEQDLRCNIKMYGAQRRIKGRMAVHGFDVYLNWTLTGGDIPDSTGLFSLRHSGTLNGGEYTYISQSRDSFDGEWNELDFTKINDDIVGSPKFSWMEFETPDTYFSYFLFGPCSLEILWRPSNEDDAFGSDLMPGLLVSQRTNSGNMINYVSNNIEGSFCRSANASDYNVKEAMEEAGTDATGLFMIDTMDSPQDQGFPYISDSCTILSGRVASMKTENKANLVKAERSCRFIFKEPNFVRCFAQEDDSDNLVLLYADCLQTFYPDTPVVAQCQQLQTTIENAGCLTESSLVCPSSPDLAPELKTKPAKLKVSPPGNPSVLD